MVHLSRRSIGLGLMTVVTLLGATPSFADWSANLIARGLDTPGATGQIECLPNGAVATVWGTGTYTSDSSICTAALHYGWITLDAGGLVGFRQVAGLERYEGTSQNGVTTLDYGSWSSSFQITSAEPLGSNEGQAIQITWNDDVDAIGFGDRVGERVTVICPADRFGAGQVWGTDVYSSDSPICNAAVHRGLMVAADGGTMTILILGEQPAFTGSIRNGVTTADYGSWPRSYTFQ